MQNDFQATTGYIVSLRLNKLIKKIETFDKLQNFLMQSQEKWVKHQW